MTLWKHIIDAGAALTTALGVFLGWMPKMGAFLAVTWYLIIIWESQTVARLRVRFRPLVNRPTGMSISNPMEKIGDDDHA